MAFLQVDMYSKMLTRQTEIAVIIPDRLEVNEKCPVLWLLHGACDNYSGWWRNTAVELYAEQHGIAVVMPSGDNSFYSNCSTGRYFDYIAEELRDTLCRMLPLSDNPTHHVVGGLSMGGHGAYKFGLTRPELYAGMAIMSAGNFIDLGDPLPGSMNADLNQKLFGTTNMQKLVGTEHDIIHLAEVAAASGIQIPELHVWCGTSDLGFETAKSTYKHLTEKLGVKGLWNEREGAHDWYFWSEIISEVMAWCAEVVGKKQDK